MEILLIAVKFPAEIFLKIALNNALKTALKVASKITLNITCGWWAALHNPYEM